MPFFVSLPPLCAHVELCTKAQTQTVYLLETFVCSHPQEQRGTGAAMFSCSSGIEMSSLALASLTSQHAPSAP
jgi:hypothetical protein